MPYNLNNQPVNLSEEPVLKDGRNYVPLKEVVEKLGGQVAWDDAAKTARATIGQWTAAVQMASDTVDVNGQKVTLSAPPYVEGNKMYVPWDFFRAAYGYKSSMEGDTLYVHL